MEALFYCLMFGFLATHELDAVHKAEWRVLPLTAHLPETLARRVFVWGHAPLFAAFVYFGAADPTSPAARWISVFSIAHVGLHQVFRHHPEYRFNTFGSRALILGAGLFGAAHLGIALLT